MIVSLIILNVALLQLAKECSRGDTHLLLGYLLSLATVSTSSCLLNSHDHHTKSIPNWEYMHEQLMEKLHE